MSTSYAETVPSEEGVPFAARIDPTYLNGCDEQELRHRIDKACELLNNPAYNDSFRVHVAYWILRGEDHVEQ